MTSGFVDYVNRIILGKVKIYVCYAKRIEIKEIRFSHNSKLLRIFRIFYYLYKDVFLC